MKKNKIVLFTLLLSIIGVVGSTNAASVNNSSRSADLMPSAASQLIQNSSLSKTNIESSESGKCILWSPRIRNFKKGDQVKVLLPHGKYTGKTLSVKVVNHGEEIATLTLEHGSDYGVITFTVNANSGEIAQIIAGFGSMDFGAIGAGGVIDIGGMTGGCTGNTASKAPVAPVIELSSSLSNRNDDNIGSSSIDAHSFSIKASSSSLSSKSSRISSSIDDEAGKAVTRSFSRVNSGSSRSSWPSSSSYHGKGIIIDYGPGPVSIIIPPSSSSSSSLISASSTDKDTHRYPGWCPEKSSSRSKSSLTVKSSSSKLSLSSSSLVKSSSSSLTASSSSLKKLPASKSSSTSSSVGSSQSSKRSESKVKRSSMMSSSLLSWSSNRKSSSSISKSSKWASSSSVKGNGHHSRESIIIVVPVPEPGPVKENSVSINLNHSSSTIKIPAKIDHSSKKLPKISKKIKPAESKSHKNAKAKTEHAKAKAVKSAKTKTESAKVKSVKAAKAKTKAESRSTRKERVAGLPQKQTAKRAVRQASQPMVDQNGNLHLNPQQVQTLEHKMPKAVKKADAQPAWRSLTANVSKQGLPQKHRNAAHPVSNVHRVTLPIQGILPATRMDSYTWLYSLIGLAIMIVSGRAFFSKKQK
ncbi:hypothetical protein QUW37_02485 [Ligilactobacillus aviarius]|uniref:hypothetical protein n=1 Tax=Ligilactobacillus aviarius TaxID=1606 RepID=UPI0024BA2C16|nr:hypothetical protein [Ligilactobacillus aviarius]MDM8278088.1 hypothetical protein [Ligilactobacillus aviarius]